MICRHKTTWDIQSIDHMKYTKDVVMSPPTPAVIGQLLDKTVQFGANYAAISVVYPNPTGGNANALVRQWVSAARTRNLKVWFRLSELSFEGIYNTPKQASPDGYRHIKNISDWITQNKDLFLPGDIFTPEAEPQNGGITGVNYVAGGVAQFSSAADFNSWLRMATLVLKQTLAANGISGVLVGYWGFDGFITAGLDNPDWQGKSFLEPATVLAMDNVICIDHYPTVSTMAQALTIIRGIFPNAQIVIGEYGAIHSETTDQVTAVLQACDIPYVTGFNYWNMGPAGPESLINSNFVNLPYAATLQSFFKPNG